MTPPLPRLRRTAPEREPLRLDARTGAPRPPRPPPAAKRPDGIVAAVLAWLDAEL